MRLDQKYPCLSQVAPPGVFHSSRATWKCLGAENLRGGFGHGKSLGYANLLFGKNERFRLEPSALCVYTKAVFQYRHAEEGFMALSIRNPRAEKLAREVAAESGESITQAIIHALEERLVRLKGRRCTTEVADEIMKISIRCRALPERDRREADEILGYDEMGVPKQ